MTVYCFICRYRLLTPEEIARHQYRHWSIEGNNPSEKRLKAQDVYALKAIITREELAKANLPPDTPSEDIPHEVNMQIMRRMAEHLQDESD